MQDEGALEADVGRVGEVVSCEIGGGIENLAEADQRTQEALSAQAAAKKSPICRFPRTGGK